MKKSTITQKKYDDINTTKISLKLNNKNDADILNAIDKKIEEEKISKQGAIKTLIREAIKSQ